MFRKSKNIVLAAERMPALFRPGNQAVLERSSAANRSYTDPRDFIPGMGPVQAANGTGDNGLDRTGFGRRFHALRSHLRASKAQAAGSPNENPGEAVVYTTTEALMAQMPSAGIAQVVARVQRDPTSAWEVVRRTAITGSPIFTADLVKEGETVFTSDELATETDARNFVQSQQFARSFLNDRPSPYGSAFNRSLFAQTSPFAKPANLNAATRASQQMFEVAAKPAPVYTNMTRHEEQRLLLDGFTPSATTAGAVALGAVGLVALYLMYRR